MKKLKNILQTSLVSLWLYVNSISVAFAVPDEPLRLQQAESIFVNVIIAAWALSIPFFIFVVISIGGQWMLSAGDEQKLASLKTKGKNVILSFALVFGGYLIVKLVMSLIGLRDPDSCFTSPIGGNAMFQFFFPEACN
ncbi:hypothetical protein ACFLY9_02280 [Patescibacteria group bacterium]